MKSVIDQIKNSLSPSRIIGSKLAIKPKGGGEYHGLCPFHKENTPSFTISDEKGFYHCFGCGAHGDIFSYVMQTEGLSYRDALEKLASEAGVSLPKFSPKQIEQENALERIYQIFEITTDYYHKSLFTNEGRSALTYLRSRGLSDDIIKKFRLGYAPSSHSDLLLALKKNYSVAEIVQSTVMNKGNNSEPYNMFRGRVMFPITDKKGRVIAFGGRILGQGEPKYLNSPDNPVFKKGQELFAHSTAHPSAYKLNEIILVEGYMDALSLINAGIQNVVAPLGTAVRMDQISLMWNIVDTPIVCLDSDNAGKRAMAKLAVEAIKLITSKKTLKFVILNGAKDPDEFISKHGVDAFVKAKESALSLADFIFEIEKNAKPLTTPEAKADLKNRLMSHVENIKDANLKNSYKKYYNDKLFSKATFSNRKVAELNQASIISSLTSQDISLEARILVILLDHPNLLNRNDVFEMLVNIELESKPLDKVRNYLLSKINSPFNIDAELDDSLSMKDVLFTDSKLKKAMNSSIVTTFNGSDIEAESEVLRAFKLLSLKKLQDQIEVAKREVISSSNEKAFERLAELKRHEELLKTELDLL